MHVDEDGCDADRRSAPQTGRQGAASGGSQFGWIRDARKQGWKGHVLEMLCLAYCCCVGLAKKRGQGVGSWSQSVAYLPCTDQAT